MNTQFKIFEDDDFNNLNQKYNGEVYKFAVGNAYSDISDELYEELYEKFLDTMPYGVAKARTEDPYVWIQRRLNANMINI
jgi:hypothetical protein